MVQQQGGAERFDYPSSFKSVTLNDSYLVISCPARCSGSGEALPQSDRGQPETCPNTGRSCDPEHMRHVLWPLPQQALKCLIFELSNDGIHFAVLSFLKWHFLNFFRSPFQAQEEIYQQAGDAGSEQKVRVTLWFPVPISPFNFYMHWLQAVTSGDVHRGRDATLS